jgi:hypothetical protein
MGIPAGLRFSIKDLILVTRSQLSYSAKPVRAMRNKGRIRKDADIIQRNKDKRARNLKHEVQIGQLTLMTYVCTIKIHQEFDKVLFFACTSDKKR